MAFFIFMNKPSYGCTNQFSLLSTKSKFATLVVLLDPFEASGQLSGTCHPWEDFANQT